MKTLHLIAAAATISLASCAPLAGTSLAFDADGNAFITAARPFVIPAK